MSLRKVKFTDNTDTFISLKESAVDTALSRMTRDIINNAKVTMPYKTGDMQGSIKELKMGRLKYAVLVNKEYASYQERGMRKDGSRKVRNYTTPGTSARFLKNAGDRVVKNGIEYIRQANNLAKL